MKNGSKVILERKSDLKEIRNLIESFQVVAILGARQCGKTTLAKQIKYDHYFDLENPRDIVQMQQPQLALEDLSGLIVIDEIQRTPDLFPLIRYLVDDNPDQKYLILGSASKDLIRQSSESLAGRIGYYYLSGFSIQDVGDENIKRLWSLGQIPRSYLAESEDESLIWRENYISTFLERDIPQLGIKIPAQTLRRFWAMLSHYHGQLINYSEFGRSFGISDVSIRKYIDILEGTFMIRALQPWHTNINKRLVKRPKIYFRDSGIFHALQSIETMDQLLIHNKLGASWEGFALECTCKIVQKRNRALYFWNTHSGAKVDLFWQSGSKNLGIEFKYMDSPTITKSMRSAEQDLALDHLWIIYPGNQTYKLANNITVLALKHSNETLSEYI
jgi:predicted AAA+ superfamily ATPase